MDPVRAVLTVDVVAGKHEQVKDYLTKSLGANLKNAMVVFGKPDIYAVVEASSLAELSRLVNRVAEYEYVRSTDTKIEAP